MANYITYFRILCSVALLFLKPLSIPFFFFFSLAGISDFLDGYVARKTNTVSEFGSKIDTLADFVFMIVSLIKLLPILGIPKWIFIWVAVITFIKIVVVNFIYGDAIHGRFVSIHNIANKITGIFLFIFPFTFKLIDMNYSIVFLCGIATIAAIIEWITMARGECAYET